MKVQNVDNSRTHRPAFCMKFVRIENSVMQLGADTYNALKKAEPALMKSGDDSHAIVFSKLTWSNHLEMMVGEVVEKPKNQLLEILRLRELNQTHVMYSAGEEHLINASSDFFLSTNTTDQAMIKNPDKLAVIADELQIKSIQSHNAKLFN